MTPSPPPSHPEPHLTRAPCAVPLKTRHHTVHFPPLPPSRKSTNHTIPPMATSIIFLPPVEGNGIFFLMEMTVKEKSWCSKSVNWFSPGKYATTEIHKVTENTSLKINVDMKRTNKQSYYEFQGASQAHLEKPIPSVFHLHLGHVVLSPGIFLSNH